MGMLDVLKRWFGGGKPQPAKTVRPAPPSAPVTRPIQSAAPVSNEPIGASTTQPTEPVAVEASEDAAPANAKSAQAFVERRVKPRVNARDGTRVLIIDDSPTIVALLKRMLEQSGYQTLDASDADTGLHLALSEVPDLIFLDIVLPGMNGFEALRRLRRDPISKTIPVVMISGNELATEQFYAQRIGADDFMKKPFARSEVFVRIEKLLDAEKVPRRHQAVAAAASVAPVPVAGASAIAATPTAAPATPAAATAVPLPAISATAAAATAAAAPTSASTVTTQETLAPAVEAAKAVVFSESAPESIEVSTAVEATAEVTAPGATPPAAEASAAVDVPAIELAPAPSQSAEKIADVAVVEPAAAADGPSQVDSVAGDSVVADSVVIDPVVAAPTPVDDQAQAVEVDVSEPAVAAPASTIEAAPETVPAPTPDTTRVEAGQSVHIASTISPAPVIAATNVPSPVQQVASS